MKLSSISCCCRCWLAKTLVNLLLATTSVLAVQPGTRSVSTGAQLAAAFIDSSVSVAVIEVGMLSLVDADWPSLHSPMLLQRNLTVRGSAELKGWPLLRSRALKKVQLGKEVTLRFEHVTLDVPQYDNMLRVPTLHLLAPSVSAAGGAVLMLQDAAIISVFCYPSSIQRMNADSVPRVPGDAANYSAGLPQPGCVNSTSVPVLERCWPDRGVFHDGLLIGADTDVGGNPVSSNYTWRLLNSSYLCRGVLEIECITKLGPIGCMLVAIRDSAGLPPLDQQLLRLPHTGTATAGEDGGGAGGGLKGGGRVLAIVLCTVGGVALLAAAVWGALLLRRRRRASRQLLQGAGKGPSPEPATQGAGPDAAYCDDCKADGDCDGSLLPVTAVTLPSGNSMDGPLNGTSMRGSSVDDIVTLRTPFRPFIEFNAHLATIDTEDGDHRGAGWRAPADGAAVLTLRASGDGGGGGGDGGGSSMPGPGAAAAAAATTIPAAGGGGGGGSGGEVWSQGAGAAVTAAGLGAAAAAGAAGTSDTASILLDTAAAGTGAAMKGADGGGGGSGGSGDDVAAADGPQQPPQQQQQQQQQQPAVVQLVPGRLLGKGGYRRVQEGVYRGQRVAVKLLLLLGTAEESAAAAEGGGGEDAAMTTFKQEVGVLGRCSHPNVLRMLAACASPPCMVFELMDSSLDHLLAEWGGRGQLLPLPTVLHIAIEVAKGLEYLHPTIIHRDLKPSNVLISNVDSPTPTVKLADFGLARLQNTILVTENANVGTAAYVSPEALNTHNCVITHRTDLYSYGVLLWQLLSGLRPWEGADMLSIALAVNNLRQRPPLEALSQERCPPALRELILHCWDQVPERRPAACEVVKELMLLQQVSRAQQGFDGASAVVTIATS